MWRAGCLKNLGCSVLNPASRLMIYGCVAYLHPCRRWYKKRKGWLQEYGCWMYWREELRVHRTIQSYYRYNTTFYSEMTATSDLTRLSMTTGSCKYNRTWWTKGCTNKEQQNNAEWLSQQPPSVKRRDYTQPTEILRRDDHVRHDRMTMSDELFDIRIGRNDNEST